MVRSTKYAERRFSLGLGRRVAPIEEERARILRLDSDTGLSGVPRPPPKNNHLVGDPL